MARNRSRDESIDILRGLAILTMIAANTAGILLRPPHPLALRLYGTFAAPLFIAISGAMVFKSAQDKPDRTFLYFLKRGLWVCFSFSLPCWHSLYYDTSAKVLAPIVACTSGADRGVVESEGA